MPRTKEELSDEDIKRIMKEMKEEIEDKDKEETK